MKRSVSPLRSFGALALAASLAVVALGLVASPARAAAPTLRIVSPQTDQVIGEGWPVFVVFGVTDFNLTQPGTVGAIANPNEGHIEVYVDGNVTAIVSELSVTLPLDSGTHVILARLVETDGTRLIPDVTAYVSVAVTHGPVGGLPKIWITYPANEGDRGADTAVTYEFANFSLVPPGRPVAPNEGHVQVYLDDLLYADLTDFEPAHFSDLGDGAHVVKLQLVDSDHNPLSPDASASVKFYVVEAHVIDINPQLTVGMTVLASVLMAVLFWPRRKKP